MKEPPQQVLHALLDYDPQTGLFTWKAREGVKESWNTRYAGKPALACINSKGYRVGAINDEPQRACRIAWVYVYGVVPKHIDHINGVRSDDRIANLRSVSNAENHLNVRMPSSNTSGVVGVHWNVEKQGWDAFITKNKVRHNLGRFKTKEEAIAVRLNAEKAMNFHPNHGRKLP